jgi:hypothetical protein
MTSINSFDFRKGRSAAIVMMLRVQGEEPEGANEKFRHSLSYAGDGVSIHDGRAGADFGRECRRERDERRE